MWYCSISRRASLFRIRKSAKPECAFLLFGRQPKVQLLLGISLAGGQPVDGNDWRTALAAVGRGYLFRSALNRSTRSSRDDRTCSAASRLTRSSSPREIASMSA